MTVVLAFDLETVPDTDAGRRLLGLAGTDAEVAAAMLERRREESNGKTDFLKPAWHRVVAVGAALVTLAGVSVEARIAAWAGVDERRLLTQFLAFLRKRPQLVSWNGSGFDMPVIRYRCLLHGIGAEVLYGPADQRQWQSYGYRYGEAHIDLMDVLSGYGASTMLTLDEMARLVGLPGKSIATGDQVTELVAAGDWHRIERYVGSDAVQTLLVFLRWERTRGRVTANTYTEALMALRGKVDPELAAAIELLLGTPTASVA